MPHAAQNTNTEFYRHSVTKIIRFKRRLKAIVWTQSLELRRLDYITSTIQ